MRPDDTVEHSALSWIKKELDAVLNQARLALEGYIEEPEQGDALQECMEHLKQVHGTLQMVELYGAAMLTEEMQAVVNAVRDGSVKNPDDAFEVLMRAMLQLPDYLEHIQTGHRDIPIVLLPLLNDLRATREASLLSENVLFFPDLASAPKIGETQAADGQDAQSLAKKLRHPFQLALLGWLRDRDVRPNLMKLLAVSSRLGKACEPGSARNFWWIVAAVLEALALGTIKPNATLKQLVGQIERLMKQMAAEPESEFADHVPPELTRNLLYYVAGAPAKGEHVTSVKKAYKLDRLLPAGADLDAARDNLMGGANLELLNTVAQAIREDLAEVKDNLELFVHAQNRGAGELAPLAEKLHRIADTIGMLGLGEPRHLVMEEAKAIQKMVDGQNEADDARLLDMAGVMLNVESLIDDFVSGRSGGGADLAEISKGAKSLRREDISLPESEYKGVVAAAIREILTDMNKAKESILEYVAAPQEPALLKSTPQYLQGIRGALSVLPLGRLIPLIDSIRAYIVDHVLTKGQEPSAKELEALADAITSVEFYLESLANDRGEYTQIIEVGNASVAKLGYPVTRQPTAEIEKIELDHAVPGEADASVGETAEAPLSDLSIMTGEETLEAPLEDWVPKGDLEPTLENPLDAANTEFSADELLDLPVDEEESESVVAEEPAPEVVPEPEPELQPLVGEVDDEILEIFLEEAEEEIERINEFLPKWEQNHDDEESLTTVRRSFHTLKGSGRLVGAQLIGEFAWAFESLLNRVIDKTIEPAPHIFEMLHKSVQVLPQLVAQVRGEGEPEVDVPALMREAEAMSKPGYAESLGQAPVEEESEDDLNAFIETEEPEGIEDASAESEVEEIELSADDLGLDEVTFSDEDESIEIDLEGPAPEPAPEQRLDPVLYGIFKTEAEQHLRTIELYLQQGLDGREGLPVTQDLIRALHTLNGSARTAGVPEMSSVFGALEHYAKARDEEDLVLPAKALDLLSRSVGHARTVLDALRDPGIEMPDASTLTSEIEQALHADLMSSQESSEPAQAEVEAPEPVSEPEEFEEQETAPEMPAARLPEVEAGEPDMPGDQDLELVDIFLEEAVEIMDASDNSLERFEADSGDQEAVTEFQRQLHTLKGGARMAGFKNIGNLSHAVESLMITLVDGQVSASPSMFQQLHAALDRLNNMLDDARAGQPVQPAPDLLATLEALRLGHELPEPAAKPAVPDISPDLSSLEAEEPSFDEGPEAVPEVPAFESEAVAVSDASAEPEMAESQGQADEAAPAEAVEPPPPAAAAPAVAEPRPTVRAAPQEQVRVRADLLDNLVNYAGEVSIYHSRLEQQITGFRFNLSELGQTVHRLREQLRKLELETEAQIRFSYEQEKGTDGFEQDFDPLELDRYSTIQQLSRALAESLSDLVSIEEFLAEQTRDAETLLLQQSRVSTDLQEGLMRTRMVQFTGMVPRLRRIVRQTAQELGKKVELDIVGESSELDRSVLERMIAPLEHMLRNAIAHGIESPEKRLSLGKIETGRVRIEIGREGSEVVIRVADDGGGVNLEAVRDKAKKQGLVKDVDALSDTDVMQLILESGFSTATEVSQIAGRGVGMDVVNSEIKQLNGVLRIDSTAGQGTTFTVRLPFTLAINQALLVQTGEDLFAVPLSSIEGIVRASAPELRTKYSVESPSIEYAAYVYELKHLGSLLNISQPELVDDNQLYPVLLVRSGDQRIALQVEGLLGSREVVVKSVGPQISKARGIAGATILGDGRVVLILDVPALVRMGVGLRLAYSAEAVVEPMEAVAEARPATVMVVDDSITIRKVTARMLERNDFGVMTAKDGVDAVAQLQEQVPDLMLLDIEMPRMDGYELAQHIRNDSRLKNVPIIMITSRTGEKHRQRAMDIGVNRYLGKPYQESDLLENIKELLAETSQA